MNTRDKLINILISAGVTWKPGYVADKLMDNGVTFWQDIYGNNSSCTLSEQVDD